MSDAAWAEVATSLDTTVSNCKKRWKSLRDTFIKYYRMSVTQHKDSKRKGKSWIYYKDLSFLMPHVELYRLDENLKSEEPSDDAIPIYLKEDYLETSNEKRFFFAEEENHDVDGVTYQIKITEPQYDDENIEHNEDHLMESAYLDEERLEEGSIAENQVMVNKVFEKMRDDEHTYMLLEANSSAELVEDGSQYSENTLPPQQQSSKFEKQDLSNLPSSSSSTSIISPQKNVVDPDERYLLSCLPAFKRLNPKQKAYVRLGIERLFYEVEFENISNEPRNKKPRTS